MQAARLTVIGQFVPIHHMDRAIFSNSLYLAQALFTVPPLWGHQCTSPPASGITADHLDGPSVRTQWSQAEPS